jgi:molybdopterin/thiamine biosynthesis adenylyltransferase/nitroreductase
MNGNDRTINDLRARVASLGFQNRHHYLEEALARNAGLLSTAEQTRLLDTRVAIPGLGGVGGVHLVTLARMGFGGFRLADFDTFEPANVNRQYGAKLDHFGRPKLAAMAAEARQINPYIDLALFPEGVTSENVTAFLTGADIVVDGIDFFAFEIRRLIFNRAREMGIPVLTAGPMGFSAAVLLFLPDRGMGFDEYFAITPSMSQEEKLLAFFIGLAPRGTQMAYVDAARIDMRRQQGPSIAAACQLCAAVAATEAVRIILKRPGVRPAPHYLQYDPMVGKFHRGRLPMGNRHPWQRFKLNRLTSRWLGDRGPLTPEWRPAPRLNPPPEHLSAPVREYILQAAIQAPSGDNCQPWRFDTCQDRISLYLRPELDRSLFNVRQYASLIACGAAIENMQLAATRYGFDSRIDCFPRPSEALRVADIHFRARGRAEDPLQRFIAARHTNRTAYDGRRLRPAVLEALRAECEPFPGVELDLVASPEGRKAIARLVWRADCIRLQNRELHAHFMHMLRFTHRAAAYCRDGLPLANLEAGMGGELFLRLSRPWPVMQFLNRLGAARLIAGISYQGIMQASAVGLLKCPGHGPRDYLEGGRALQRIWLAATREGLAFQPMTAITLFRLRWQLGRQDGLPRGQRRSLESILTVYENLFPPSSGGRQGHIMLFRIGYGRPVACRTLRRPIPTFLSK